MQPFVLIPGVLGVGVFNVGLTLTACRVFADANTRRMVLRTSLQLGMAGVLLTVVGGIIQVVVSAAAADESFNASVEEVLVGAVIGLVVAALTTAILLLVRSDR